MASFAWAPPTLAASKAAKAAAAAARACGCMAQSSAICAAAFAIEAVIGAADSECRATSSDDPEVEARAEAVKVCITAQLQAASCGVKARTPRAVAGRGQVARRNIAVHDFDLGRPFADITEGDAVRLQRARGRKGASKHSSGPEVEQGAEPDRVSERIQGEEKLIIMPKVKEDAFEDHVNGTLATVSAGLVEVNTKLDGVLGAVTAKLDGMLNAVCTRLDDLEAMLAGMPGEADIKYIHTKLDKHLDKSHSMVCGIHARLNTLTFLGT